MKQGIFIHAKEVATELGISEAHAYKLVRGLNSEFERNGFIVISKIPSMVQNQVRLFIVLRKRQKLII